MNFSKKILAAINEGVYNALSFDDELPDVGEVSMKKISNTDVANSLMAKLDKLSHELEIYHKFVKTLLEDEPYIFEDDYNKIIEYHYKYGCTISPKKLGEILNNSRFHLLEFIKIILSTVPGDELDLNWIDTSEVTNMNATFMTAQTLSGLKINEWDVSNVTDMGAMFKGCMYLTDLDLAGWNVANVVYMHDMFNGCESIDKIDISNWDTKSLQLTKNMFSSCDNLENIIGIEDLYTSNVTSMRYMFYGCYSLYSLDLNKWDTSKVGDMTCMFNACSNIEELYIDKWDVSNVDSFYGMFSQCQQLIRLDLPKWYINSRFVNVLEMFSQCENLENINMESFDLTHTNYEFVKNHIISDCNNLKSFITKNGRIK